MYVNARVYLRHYISAREHVAGSTMPPDITYTDSADLLMAHVKGKQIWELLLRVEILTIILVSLP